MVLTADSVNMTGFSTMLSRTRLTTVADFAHRLLFLCLLLSLIVLHGCILSRSVSSRIQTADELARAAGLHAETINTNQFQLQSWLRIGSNPTGRLDIYIEGDGLAWRNKRRLSDNPTPINPIGLKLAIAADADNVVYLARPCQFLTSAACQPQLWSTHRYSEAVVASMNQAIQTIVDRSAATAIRLVGYSGGGVIAALVAARRDDVSRLITVASNLDHAAWTAQHKVTPLHDSLNPADYAEQLKLIPQLHFSGENDDIVSESVLLSYLQQLQLDPSQVMHRVDGADHDCCWAKQWPSLLKIINRQGDI